MSQACCCSKYVSILYLRTSSYTTLGTCKWEHHKEVLQSLVLHPFLGIHSLRLKKSGRGCWRCYDMGKLLLIESSAEGEHMQSLILSPNFWQNIRDWKCNVMLSQVSCIVVLGAKIDDTLGFRGRRSRGVWFKRARWGLHCRRSLPVF